MPFLNTNLSLSFSFPLPHIKVPDDALRLRVPVWIADLVFLDPQDPRTIVTGTGYKQIRVYDTRVKRRPILNVDFGEKAVRSMEVMGDGRSVLLSDTIGNLTVFDTRAAKTTGSYRGFSGTVTDMDVTQSSVASVSLDRHARIHQAHGSRRLVHKVYLKQRLSAILLDDTEGTCLGKLIHKSSWSKLGG